MAGPSSEQWCEATSKVINLAAAFVASDTVREIRMVLVDVPHPEDQRFATWFFEGNILYKDGTSTVVI